MKKITTAILLSQLLVLPVFADEVFIDVSGATTQSPGNAGTGFDADTLTTIFSQLQLFADTTTVQYDTNVGMFPGPANTGDRFLDSGSAIITSLLPLGDSEGISTPLSEITVDWNNLSGILTSDLTPVGPNYSQTFDYDTNNTLFNFYFHGDATGPNASAGALGYADNVGFTDGEKILEMQIMGGAGTNTFDGSGNFVSGSSILDGQITMALPSFWYYDNGDNVANTGSDNDFFDLMGLMVPITMSMDQNTDQVVTDFSNGGALGPGDVGHELFAVHSTHDGSLDFAANVTVPEPKTLPFFALGLLLILFLRRTITDCTPSFRLK